MKEKKLSEVQARLLKNIIELRQNIELELKRATQRQDEILSLVCDANGIENLKSASVDGDRLIYEVEEPIKEK